jgi:hypothetical protein
VYPSNTVYANVNANVKVQANVDRDGNSAHHIQTATPRLFKHSSNKQPRTSVHPSVHYILSWPVSCPSC